MRDSVGWHAPVLIDQEGGASSASARRSCSIIPPASSSAISIARTRAGPARRLADVAPACFRPLRFGINIDCLPVLDVPVEGSSNVIGNRAYGGDPTTVTEMGVAAAEGLKAGGLLPVMKHMPGHGRGLCRFPS
jgi:beta-N-acetylhexosaminidase